MIPSYTHAYVPSSHLEPEVAHIISTIIGQDFFPHLLLVQIPLLAYPTFRLEKAVCNHGFFMMAPNRWDPPTKTLTRPLRFVKKHKASEEEEEDSALVLIRHCPLDTTMLQAVFVDTTPDLLLANPANLTSLMGQLTRMLRISAEDEVVSSEFQKLCPEAVAHGFGRLFRSPTLFEDIIKSILLSNCGWDRSLALAEALCEVELGNSRNSLNNFPSPKEFACLEKPGLKLCKLGYRADIISSITKKVLDGSLPEYEVDHPVHHDSNNCSLLIQELIKINGIGPFVAANISMCIGSYRLIPIDSETYRHFLKVHDMIDPTERNIKDMYQKHAPYESLSYWFEHLMLYEREFGKLSELAPSKYHLVTSSTEDHKRKNTKKATKSLGQSKKISKKKKGLRNRKGKKLLFTM